MSIPISIRTALYTGHRPYPYTLETCVKRVSAIGYKAIELVCPVDEGSLGFIDRKGAKAVSKMLDEYGLTCPTISAVGYLNKASPLKAERDKSIKDELNIMEVAHEVGAKKRVWGCGRIVWDLADRQQTWGYAKETIMGVLPLAEKYDVTLAIEPQLADSNLILEPEDAIRMMKDIGSKHVKLMIDTLHQLSINMTVTSVRRPLNDWVYAFGKDLVHVHLRAGSSAGEFGGVTGLPPLPVTKAFIKALKSIGYSGYLCNELTGFDVDVTATEALDFLLPLVK